MTTPSCVPILNALCDIIEVYANAVVVIILQFMNISNRHVIQLKLKKKKDTHAIFFLVLRVFSSFFKKRKSSFFSSLQNKLK